MPEQNTITEQKPQNIAKSNTEATLAIMDRIHGAQNILVALSSDPSVDEMAAAIGLSMFLDKMGKRATAIYSGATPNALEFLKPNEAFDSTADVLQDFVVALNKEKADHLRYKLDGDFVKIYITPYKTRISNEDLDFSYGDFNVDLVLALDVANGVDLDAALREHGRIMHDASVVNITTGKPGKFGEIEWSDTAASSISEMIAGLLYGLDDEVALGKEEATAFLTGVVAATNRFSNARTTSATMELASRLMKSGANQQLVSQNITPEIENELAVKSRGIGGAVAGIGGTTVADEDPTKLDIVHEGDKDVKAAVGETQGATQEEKFSGSEVQEGGAREGELEVSGSASDTNSNEQGGFSGVRGDYNDPQMLPVIEGRELEEELKAAAEDLKKADAAGNINETGEVPGGGIGKASEDAELLRNKPELVVTPSEGVSMGSLENEESKYGQMLEEALAEPENMAPVSDGAVNGAQALSENVNGGQNIDGVNMAQESAISSEQNSVTSEQNPAVANAPTVAVRPEINGVPEINYMPMPGDEMLPPPPAPPINMGEMPQSSVNMDSPKQADLTGEASTGSLGLAEAAPVMGNVPEVGLSNAAVAGAVSAPSTNSLGSQPAMQDQIYSASANDPGAFRIPGA